MKRSKPKAEYCTTCDEPVSKPSKPRAPKRAAVWILERRLSRDRRTWAPVRFYSLERGQDAEHTTMVFGPEFRVKRYVREEE